MHKILWFVGLFALFFAGDRLAGMFLAKQVESSQFRYSKLYTDRAKADILLIGNSRGLTFFQPHIEKVTGKSSFNLSYNGMPMNLANALVQDYLDKYPAPSTLVVDVTTCDRVNNELVTGFLPYSKYSERISQLLIDSLPKFYYGGMVTHLSRYNSEVFQRAMYYRSNSDTDWIVDRVMSADLIASLPKDTSRMEVNPFLIGQLAEMVKKAQSKGVAVKLVVSPYFPDYIKTGRGLPELITSVEKATGLPVHNYAEAVQNPELFGDFKHPNRAGSIQFIDKMKADGVLP